MQFNGQKSTSISTYGRRTTFRIGIYNVGDKASLAFATVGADRAARPAKGALFSAVIPGPQLLSQIGRFATKTNGGLFGEFTGIHKSGYIAFEATANAHEYFGWLKVKVNFDGQNRPHDVTLVSVDGNVYGAYDLASSAVADGFKVGSEASAIPEPVRRRA
jgi:hypothetical protein